MLALTFLNVCLTFICSSALIYIMDKFLQKIEFDLENKILSCIHGESIIKPFLKIFDEVREKNKKITTKKSKVSLSENSIYNEVIREFLKDNPEFIKEKEENEK
ncbi:hypothetical protein GW796_10600 [archaeon]|nr:hypothetical protein [archaeon]